MSAIAREPGRGPRIEVPAPASPALPPVLLDGGRARRPALPRRAVRIVSVIAGRALLAASFAVLLVLGVGPQTGAYRTLTVLTGSMRPSIPPGSIVVVAKVPAWTLQAGDVITYNAPLQDGRVVTHRVVSARQRDGAILVTTKGDANAEPDPWLAAISEPVVWKVRAVVPQAGRAIGLMRSLGSSRTALLVLAGLTAVLWLLEIWAPARKEPDA